MTYSVTMLIQASFAVVRTPSTLKKCRWVERPLRMTARAPQATARLEGSVTAQPRSAFPRKRNNASC
jgi:hypothetical protein